MEVDTWERRDSRTCPGGFVVVVGPDGVGKTTLATSLMRAWDGPVSYFHFLPTSENSMISDPGVVHETQVPQPKPSRNGNPVMGVARILRNVIRSWFAYWKHIRPRVRRGAIVVGDRWVYGYVGQPYSLRFYGPSWLAKVGVRFAPKPDLLIRLSAGPELIAHRKAELSISEIRTEIGLWKTLDFLPQLDLDTGAEPDRLALQAVEKLRERLGC